MIQTLTPCGSVNDYHLYLHLYKCLHRHEDVLKDEVLVAVIEFGSRFYCD